MSSDARTIELESELRRGFDRETLAVYADHLQSRGDLRGELIAIDLLADEHALSPEQSERRVSLLFELLGDLATHPAIVCSYGFLDLVGHASGDVLDELLYRPFSVYLRSAILRASRSRTIASQILAIVAQSRPWLSALDLVCSARLSRRLATRLVARAPCLERLAITGRDVWPAVSYPGVRRLRLTTIDAIPALLATDPLPPCFPDVVELELELPRMYVGPTWDQQRAMLPPAQLPSLRTLDLERCAAFDAFRFVRHLAIAPQLAILRLGGMRTQADYINVQAALDRMPDLVRLEVRGGHQHLRDALQHPRAEIIRRKSFE